MAIHSQSVPVAAQRKLFCNRTLNLRAIKAIGYDMDYTLIHYHVEKWEECAYEHMKQHMDIHADAGTYSIVLKSLSFLDRHNEVVNLAREISKDFIEIDMVLYATLMDVYGRAGKFDEALDFYDKIVASGQKPSVICLQILMHIHCLRYGRHFFVMRQKFMIWLLEMTWNPRHGSWSKSFKFHLANAQLTFK
jgi:pentatricopeptide repeat protein